jgi:hypothetical protein
MFAVEVPKECDRVSVAPRERRSIARGIRVALVEDNVILLESLTVALQSNGIAWWGLHPPQMWLMRRGRFWQPATVPDHDRRQRRGTPSDHGLAAGSGSPETNEFR